MDDSSAAGAPTGPRPAAGVGSIEIAGLRHHYGDVEVLAGVTLAVEAGSTVALLGPSGCGKTTLLRTIAGLERPTAGTVAIDGEAMAGPSTWTPPERRRVGLVFQDWALFPHRTVAGNVAYGLPRSERVERVAQTLALVGLAGFEERLPTTLSGGQQQRVALARALAPRPRVLLLDEPFSNLDASRRVEVRSELRALLGQLGTTAVFVTHDQAEAFVLGDRVALMHGGRIVQIDTPDELYRRPANRWAAEFVGDAVVLSGTADGATATTVIGVLPLDRSMTGPVDVIVRPEQLRLVPEGAATPALPTVAPLSGAETPLAVAERETAGGVVQAVEYYGYDAIVHLVVDGQPVRIRTGPDPIGAPGQRVGVVFDGDRATAFDRRA